MALVLKNSTAAAGQPDSSAIRGGSRGAFRRWTGLVALAFAVGVGVHLWQRPPALPVPPLEQPESMDPQLRFHLEQLSQYARKNSRDPEARAALGIAFAANGLWKEARLTFLDAVRLSPDEPLAHLYAAISRQELADSAGALTEFRAVTSRFPRFPQGWYRVAELSLRAGDLAVAEKAFQRLVELAPTEWRGPAGLGEIRIQQGQPTEALPWLEKARNLDPTAKPVLYLLGQAYRSIGRTNEARLAIAAGTGAERHPMPDPWGDVAPAQVRSLPDLLSQADALSQNGRSDVAVQLLRGALPFHPGHAGLLNQYAIALNRAGQPAQALLILDDLIRKVPTDVVPRITRAYTQNLLGNTQAGLSDALEAVRLSPRMSQAHLAHANALLAGERDADAAVALEEAIRCDPGNPEIRLELGQVLWRNLDRQTDALVQFEKAVELNPALSRGHALLGHLHLARGNRSAARQAAETLHQLAPNSREDVELSQRLASP